MLKKSILIVALLLIATNLWAVKTLDVSGTRHNLSTTSVNIPGGNYYMANNEDEVCIFCHTPHGGSLDGPLWNRGYMPAGNGFTHYSSATISGYLAGESGRNVNTESLLCMACHDGTTAMNNIINSSNRTDAIPDGPTNNKMAPGFFGPGPVVGDVTNPSGFGTLGHSKNLSDDHPISFSYYSSWNHVDNTGKFNHADGVAANDPRDKGGIGKGVRFFGADQVAGGQRIECSTCHDPHVNHETTTGGDAAYGPFLVMPNTGSALCLACHIK